MLFHCVPDIWIFLKTGYTYEKSKFRAEYELFKFNNFKQITI